MVLKNVVAIVRKSVLGNVEERLERAGVKGITVSSIKGFGEYANLYKEDWMVGHVKIEIFTEQSAVEDIVAAIMDSAHVGMAGDGLVAVHPVEKIFRIRSKAEVKPGEC